MNAYTLTAMEASIYDSGDDVAGLELLRDLRGRFGGTGTEVYHPEGFVAAYYPEDAHAGIDTDGGAL